MRTTKSPLRLVSVAAIAACVSMGSAKAALIINEIFSGGGTSTSTVLYKKDYIELFNTGSSAVDISGYYLDYASAVGSFSANNRYTIPTGTSIGANNYLLVATGTAGTGGADFEADLTTTLLSMSATAGKVRFVDSTIAATSQAASGAGVLDFVGYGTNASLFEGAGRAPTNSLTTSISRTNFIDTQNNAADFTSGDPSLTRAVAIPEPATLTLLGMSVFTISCRIRAKKKART